MQDLRDIARKYKIKNFSKFRKPDLINYIYDNIHKQDSKYKTPDIKPDEKRLPDIEPDEGLPDIEPDEGLPDIEPDEGLPDIEPDDKDIYLLEKSSSKKKSCEPNAYECRIRQVPLKRQLSIENLLEEIQENTVPLQNINLVKQRLFKCLGLIN